MDASNPPGCPRCDGVAGTECRCHLRAGCDLGTTRCHRAEAAEAALQLIRDAIDEALHESPMPEGDYRKGYNMACRVIQGFLKGAAMSDAWQLTRTEAGAPQVRVVIHTQHWATSPDIPGWTAAGDTKEELMQMIREGVAFALDREEGSVTITYLEGGDE